MCLICDRIEMIKKHQNKFFVKELRTGYVVLGDNQHFKGYTLFLYKNHVGELYKLDGNEKIEFLEEMSLVGEAVSKTVRCEKMNYELLGNGDSHLHWHLFPRVSGDLENYGYHGKGPVWWYPREKIYSANNELGNAELEELKPKLRLELDKIFL
ncbi:HIT family protein [Lactobacillus taiwanensis]|uniref:HIT family protein n=1 Tax=Lactobacillus taiwanensis TaxID=508451 RepID=A0A256LC74_9LACO|nr:HIT family protein [Lactobacillus taiwanensis]OYR87391.1 HIT family protein [Lactobacillus taiwanensis]OYR89385.1 HIT family protein [Lactobacillus taiwanensis]OYR91011.1 HIT family protein [Lactobacillus taiwanensis]OYR94418.1 HIT family protein [Lactobacillus taiwanensis]